METYEKITAKDIAYPQIKFDVIVHGAQTLIINKRNNQEEKERRASVRAAG